MSSSLPEPGHGPGESDPPTSSKSTTSIFTTTVASSPFDRSGADVALLSSDHVHFYVYKTVLLLASSFFETMFSLQQPASDIYDGFSPLSNRPVIAVSEDSATLDALLRFCYPVDDPEIQTLEQLDKVLEAALKYDIPVAVKLLRRALQAFVPDYSREVFAVASRHSLEGEAQTAARAWRGAVNAQAIDEDFGGTFAGATFIPAMGGINAGAYHRLLLYLRTGDLPPGLCSPGPPALDQEVTATTSSFSAKDGDVILKSSQDARSFKVHRLVLNINNLDILLTDASRVTAVDDVPVYQVAPDITSDTLEMLLRLCYPDGYAEDPYHGPIPGGTYSRLMEVATRYEIHTVIRTLRRNWTRDATHDPLAFYCIAARYGWLAEAQEAASLLLEAPLNDVYSPELEKATAASYQSLLKFHHLYQTIALKAVKKHGICRMSYPYSTQVDVTGSENTWAKAWLGHSTWAGKYVRNVPFILVELHAQKQHRTSKLIDLEALKIEAHAVEDTVKQAVQNIRLDFEG